MSSDASSKVLVPKRKGIFPGYWLLGAGAIMIAWGAGIRTYSFGAYVNALIAEFGWSRAQLALAYSFNRLEGGLEGPFGGIATDKWGPRAINFVGFLLFGLGLMAMYFVNSLWLFYVIWVISSTGANLGMAGPLDAAMANWFVKRRGLMMGIMRSVTSLVVPVLIPMVTWLLMVYGWRLAFLITGAGTLVIGLPLTWFFVKPKRPEYYGWLPDGERVGEETISDTEAVIKAGVDYASKTTGEVEFTVRQAMRDRIFWIFTVAVSLRGMVAPVVLVHTIPLLTDRGVDPMMAATAMGTMVLMQVPGRLGFGWLGDRVRLTRLKYLKMLSIAVEALGIFILIRSTSMPWVWAFLVVYGIGMGANIAITAPLRGRYWGRKAYATIQGATLPFTMIAGMIAPVYAGWAYDTTGSYIGAYTVLLFGLLAAFVVTFFLNPPKPPKQIGKITEIV